MGNGRTTVKSEYLFHIWSTEHLWTAGNGRTTIYWACVHFISGRASIYAVRKWSYDHLLIERALWGAGNGQATIYWVERDTQKCSAEHLLLKMIAPACENARTQWENASISASIYYRKYSENASISASIYYGKCSENASIYASIYYE